jgi:hypothetical protein
MHHNYSMLGTLFQVVQCSDDYLTNAEEAKFRFRRYRSSLCSDFPTLRPEKFPAPIQSLLVEQVCEARKFVALNVPIYRRISIPGWRDERLVDPPSADAELESQLEVYRKLALAGGQNSDAGTDILADLPRCECKWFRAWQLPCSHIWHHHLLFGSLQPAHFAQLTEIWATNGYEIYEEIQQPFEGALDNIIGVPPRVGLDWREKLEQLNAKFYSITDWLDRNAVPLEGKKLGLSHFINEVSKRLAGIDDFTLEAWVQEEYWQWI